MTDDNILYGFVKGVPHMELSRNVGRGNDYRKRYLIAIRFGAEISGFLPIFVNAILKPLRFVIFRKFHITSFLYLIIGKSCELISAFGLDYLGFDNFGLLVCFGYLTVFDCFLFGKYAFDNTYCLS